MTRSEACSQIQKMPDYSGMHKVIRKGCWDTINDEDTDWYVDYAHNVSMGFSGSMHRIEMASPQHMMQEFPVHNINIKLDMNAAIREQTDSRHCSSYSSRPYRQEAESIPLSDWLKAGVPPNGRSKKQHILIQQLNKKKKGR